MQIVPAEWLTTPGMHGPANRSNVASTARATSLSVYLKCRAVVYPKQSLLLSDRPDHKLPPCEVYCPPYVLRPPRVDVAVGKGTMIHVPAEMTEHVLHVAYAISGRLLLCIATDALGGYVGPAADSSSDAVSLTIAHPARLMETQTFHLAPKAVSGEGGYGRRMVLLLWQHICVLVSRATLPWRVVVGKLGLLSDTESQTWREIATLQELRRTNAAMVDQCGVCERLGEAGGQPLILSVTVLTLNADKHLQLFDPHRGPLHAIPGPESPILGMQHGVESFRPMRVTNEKRPMQGMRSGGCRPGCVGQAARLRGQPPRRPQGQGHPLLVCSPPLPKKWSAYLTLCSLCVAQPQALAGSGVFLQTSRRRGSQRCLAGWSVPSSAMGWPGPSQRRTL